MEIYRSIWPSNTVTRGITAGCQIDADSRLTKSKEILSEARNFYKSLYSHRKVNNLADLNSIFEKANAPILTDTMRDNLEGPLSHVELMQALKNSKNAKSPGSDGFSFEFYKFFSPDLSWFLLRSLNFAYFSGKLSVTQKYGIITLLPKGDKPRQFKKHLRSISLLNTVII